ncbi:D-alanyl-D-alanine carboxypeptidase/D-alanyl-D-alanine endopeptidase [Nocardiopsis coralliicola]
MARPPLAHPPTGSARPPWRSAAIRAAPAGAALLLAAGLAGPAAPAAASTAGADDLRADIDALLDDPSLEGAVSGVVVRSLDNGDTLYDRDAATSLIPASNMKLLTSAAALEVLGPDHRFTTGVTADSAPEGGTVEGDLHLAGGGDPTLTAEALDALAADVAAAGVTSVSGDLVADTGYFDAERYHPDWDEADEPYYYAAKIAALTASANDDYDTGAVTVGAEPGAAEGEPLDIGLTPMSPNLTVVDEASTGPAGGEPTLSVDRPAGTEEFTVSGTLPAGGDAYEDLRTVDDPALHAAGAFASALEDNGVAVAGEVVAGDAPEGAAEVADRSSEPLSELLVPFMKLSNNGHAEILMKAMAAESAGAPGSWEQGAAEAQTALKAIGLDTSAVAQTDGSGLARTNELTADTLADLLAAVEDEPWAQAWTASLPVAGDPDRMVGGTLTNRMRGTAAEGNVAAKTGTLSGVSALSGYVTGANGERLAFSIVNNDVPGGAPLEVQDSIAVRLAEFDRTTATSASADSGARTSMSAQEGGSLECTWDGTC